MLSDADHHPSKHWGQNFLVEPNIVRRMVDAAGLGPTSQVVEIGAGTGTLTGVLSGVANTVVAYEIDPSLESVLTAAVGEHANVEIRMADAANVGCCPCPRPMDNGVESSVQRWHRNRSRRGARRATNW